MSQACLASAIERVRSMETIFDELLQTAAHDRGTEWFRSRLQKLIDYYESPLWRQDFEMDEQGAFPPDLKRGVLSEDGVYDFLSSCARETNDITSQGGMELLWECPLPTNEQSADHLFEAPILIGGTPMVCLSEKWLRIF